MDLQGRHPSTVSIMRFFAYQHLPEPLREVSRCCEWLAALMIEQLPDGPELTTGLRKLLEAKDCFVRAALPDPSAASDRGFAGTSNPEGGAARVP